MFCVFRWMLVLFKREFRNQELNVLWESILSFNQTVHLHIFVAAAILSMHRAKLLKLSAFDDTLKYVNDLMMTMSVPECIQHAQLYFWVFERKRLEFLAREDWDVVLDDGIVESEWNEMLYLFKRGV